MNTTDDKANETKDYQFPQARRLRTPEYNKEVQAK